MRQGEIELGWIGIVGIELGMQPRCVTGMKSSEIVVERIFSGMKKFIPSEFKGQKLTNN